MESLQRRFEEEFQKHVQERNGLITAPQVLIDHLLRLTANWLEEQAQEWAEGEGDAEANALRQARWALRP